MTTVAPIDLEEFITAGSKVSPVGLLPVGSGELGRLRYQLPERGYLVREVRGTKMATVSALFDEFAAAFQFPAYFGANKDAFDECMQDLDEFVGPATGYLVAVRDADRLLSAEPNQRPWFLEAMTDLARYWSMRTLPITYRVVLQGQPARTRQAIGPDIPTLRLEE